LPLKISLNGPCCESDLPARFVDELVDSRRGHSIINIPGTWGEYRDAHRTARKRVHRAERLGYQCRDYDRALFENDIHLINTSLKTRQGRLMLDAKLQRETYASLPFYPCERHSIRTLGVLKEGSLVAYLLWYRVGEFAHVSETLGHGEHLPHGVMYQLFFTAIRQAQQTGARWFGYNLHASGTDGLRFFKERLGFQPMDVEWVL